MGTTNTMGIPYPESTDAVANGATAMESLAQKVDDKTGLVLVKTQVVGSTPVPSVVVTGAFSDLWDNYRIIWTNGTSSNLGALNVSLGAVTTNYFNATTYTVFATGAVASTNNNAVQGAFIYAGAMDPTNGTFLTIDLFSPFLARHTGYGGSFLVTDVAGHTGGIQKSNTVFTSFTITPSTGTLSGGTIYVYGYRK
jgi:hypothetical protein